MRRISCPMRGQPRLWRPMRRAWPPLPPARPRPRPSRWCPRQRCVCRAPSTPRIQRARGSPPPETQKRGRRKRRRAPRPGASMPRRGIHGSRVATLDFACACRCKDDTRSFCLLHAVNRFGSAACLTIRTPLRAVGYQFSAFSRSLSDGTKGAPLHTERLCCATAERSERLRTVSKVGVLAKRL